jgi:SAM-dependent methyltransferase
MIQLLQKVRNKARPPAWLFKFLNRDKEQFECPVCHYQFMDLNSFAGRRKHASKLKMLHFAPEPFFKRIFSSRVGKYETADLCMRGVDHHVDLQKLPFKDATYDFIFASHVLEHIPDDKRAIQEIRRVLMPNGVAILPVPVICEKTIEYRNANPHEAWHIRAPGLDYFERYKPYFSKVEVRTSASLPEQFQLFVYEDRTVWPTRECPLRPPMRGERHIDFVPICHV